MSNDLFYEVLQEELSRKLRPGHHSGYDGGYQDGILACKSLLHGIHKRYGFRHFPDAVNVVRCKDCKYYCSSCELLDYPYCQLLYDCGADHIETYDMNYCSWAERKEE